MESGPTSSDWFPLVRRLTGDPFSADSTGESFREDIPDVEPPRPETGSFCPQMLQISQHYVSVLPSENVPLMLSDGDLKDGVTYQQMQVSFSEKAIWIFFVFAKRAFTRCSSFNICKLLVVSKKLEAGGKLQVTSWKETVPAATTCHFHSLFV